MKTRLEWERAMWKRNSSYMIPVGIAHTRVEIIVTNDNEWAIRPIDTGLHLAKSSSLEDLKLLCRDCRWIIERVWRSKL